VQDILKSFRSLKNCVAACNQDGLSKKLDEQLSELELCEKALADFKESKRRAFPRFYFVSSNDLLDILSNGASTMSMQLQSGVCIVQQTFTTWDRLQV
jgi:dynein heavy chain, axonemal